MDTGSLYNVLIGAMIKQTIANTRTSINRNTGSNISFGDILTAVQNKDIVSAQDIFSLAFLDYDVKVKSGDCSVSSANWKRKDFPAWKFFQDDMDADSLNQWKPQGTQPTGAETSIQNALSKIGYGQMALIIPDELREKMEADPKYAWEIAEKVQKYKENYDRTDNALAVTYGNNSTLYKMTKRYCFSLDENGDVETCWVVSGGINTKQSTNVQGKNISQSKNNQQTQQTEQTQRRFTTSKRQGRNVQTSSMDAPSLLSMYTNYLNTTSYFGPSYAYNDILKNL